MQFSNLTITAGSVTQTFSPYDRGANGAYVWRKDGITVHSPRIVASATVNDTLNDKYSIQLNLPRVSCADECGNVTSLGTDLIKTEMRFLASTSSADRTADIDAHIALLEELKQMPVDRETIYS